MEKSEIASHIIKLAYGLKHEYWFDYEFHRSKLENLQLGLGHDADTVARTIMNEGPYDHAYDIASRNLDNASSGIVAEMIKKMPVL